MPSLPGVFHPTIQSSFGAMVAIARGILNSGALGTVLQEDPQTAAAAEPSTAEQATTIATTMVAHRSIALLVWMLCSTLITRPHRFPVTDLLDSRQRYVTQVARFLSPLCPRTSQSIQYYFYKYQRCNHASHRQHLISRMHTGPALR